ncbi:hypothetical protein CaO19.5329 [Kluyveromyces marxianus]|nr:hypothetical protein CaO19.5329 [Kluyveromyces marxianus]
MPTRLLIYCYLSLNMVCSMKMKESGCLLSNWQVNYCSKLQVYLPRMNLMKKMVISIVKLVSKWLRCWVKNVVQEFYLLYLFVVQMFLVLYVLQRSIFGRLWFQTPHVLSRKFYLN